MAPRKANPEPITKRRPATTPEGRENQLISAAFTLAERQIADGTASSQVLTHFLKLGSTRERKEQDRLNNEIELLRAKVSQIETGARTEALYEDAIAAMRSYNGQVPDE